MSQKLGMTKRDGYFPLYWDDREGVLWLEIPCFNADFLFVKGLAAGLGSNDIGLDRGQAGDNAIVNSAERRSVEESSPSSPICRTARVQGSSSYPPRSH
jgi:hypothetical protein